MFQKIAKHRANDASNDVHRPPLPTNRTKEIKLLLHHYEGEEIGPLPIVDEAKGEANSTSEIINDFNFRTRRITMMYMAITVTAMRERIKLS